MSRRCASPGTATRAEGPAATTGPVTGIDGEDWSVPRRSDVSWHSAADGEEELHDLVSGVRGRFEHQGAAAVDDGDAVVASVGGGVRADASRSGSAMHPHLFDAEVDTLVDGGVGEF